MKNFSSIIRILFLGIIMFFALLAVPSFSYAEYGEGYNCNAAGRAGVCWDRVSHSCGTYYDSGNYCPGDNSVQCCVNSQVRCNTYTSSYCHNASAAGFGNQYNCGAVGGSFNSGGYCPGPWDVQCCVVPQQPPPTNVTASCPAPGTSMTVNWTRPSGYTYSYARIYNETTGATCYSGVLSGTSYSCATTPGHQYSYWVHTTNSIGEPWSTEVPTAHGTRITCSAATPTPTRTPTPTPIGPCGDPAAPEGAIISTGVAVRTSAVRDNNTTTYGGQNVVDGVLDTSTYWNSGANATQWIELDLGVPQEVKGLRLYVRQSPDGVTNTQILASASVNPTTNRRTLSCYTRNDQAINVVFPAPLTNIRYIRINTTASPSDIAWNEISVYGTAPGVQTSTPGIIFSGDHSTDFGEGQASIYGWVVGGLVYPELYTSNAPSQTSYQFLLDKITSSSIPIIPMTTAICGSGGLANCTLQNNLPNAVYQATGDLNLNAYTFPANRDYIFLVDGTLRVNGNLFVPNGSTVFFSASSDIIIDQEVGSPTALFPLPAGQLQGIYSADRDFLIEGINNCVTGPDKMLNIEGAIITNALGRGGIFQTERDLCGDNPRYPALTIRLRIDMLLNLPEVLMQQKTTFREDTP